MIVRWVWERNRTVPPEYWLCYSWRLQLAQINQDAIDASVPEREALAALNNQRTEC